MLQHTGDRLPTQGWAGRDVVFMRSNDHSRDRHGDWSTEGLHGALKQVVEGDSKAPKCVPHHHPLCLCGAKPLHTSQPVTVEAGVSLAVAVGGLVAGGNLRTLTLCMVPNPRAHCLRQRKDAERRYELGMVHVFWVSKHGKRRAALS